VRRGGARRSILALAVVVDIIILFVVAVVVGRPGGGGDDVSDAAPRLASRLAPAGRSNRRLAVSFSLSLSLSLPLSLFCLSATVVSLSSSFVRRRRCGSARRLSPSPSTRLPLRSVQPFARVSILVPACSICFAARMRLDNETTPSAKNYFRV